jgi:hypothetical protein
MIQPGSFHNLSFGENVGSGTHRINSRQRGTRMPCRRVMRAAGQRDARRVIAFSYNYGHMFCLKATIF